MTDEPRKLTISDVVEYVLAAWDPTELAAYRAGATDEIIPHVVPWAITEAFIVAHVQAPEVWFQHGPHERAMYVLELIRRGAEAAEGQWDAELDAFLADTLEGDVDADGQ